VPKTFRVIDLRQSVETETLVVADTPDAAAHQVLGIEIVRGGNKRALVAKVYSETESGLSMVRLYARSAGRSSART
jgi:hypothetical protein